ncbi:MAG TPA: molybdopterin-dependent oxidoreductase, partial [Candidatus Melainabacteria bacterium]|nr:molybdopterin-dependent oxidoreductase [Candidatus Melainabacteria bacterium]
MARKLRAGGGFPAIMYSLEKAFQVGPLRLLKRMNSRNACKTCAVGMGGMKGGMVNEAGHWPEVCKKSLQAQVADMIGALPADFFDKHSLADLEKLTPKQAEDAGRLSYPVVLDKGESHFKPITWEAALKHIEKAMKETKAEHTAFYSSGRSSNEAAFLLQAFARVYGTNNVMNCSYYCHQASGVALKMAFGTGTATVELEDLARCDLVVLLGANPASNHPRLMTQLANLRARGGQVIVVNPVRESPLETFHIPSQVKSLLFGTKIASTYIQPLPGGDVAFLVGVLKSIIEKRKVDQEFIDSHAEGSAEVLDYARQADWDTLIKNSGVGREEIEKCADIIYMSKRTIFAWAMGLTHHASGVDNVLAVCNLAIATGNVGKPGAGMLPIRGHSNVQGIGSVGVATGLQDSVKQSLESIYKTKLTDTPGLDTHAMIDACGRGEINFLFVLGGNLWGSNPDSNWAQESMNRVKNVVYLSTKLNPGHFFGRGETTLILPVLARDEEPQATTQESMFNFIRFSEGGEPNIKGQMMPESEIICDIANRVLGKDPFDWTTLRDHKKVRELISKTIPGWQELGTIDDTKREFTITG